MSENQKNFDLEIDKKGMKSMGDILALPDEERRIVNWLIRHKQSTLHEVAEYTGKDELIVKTHLDELVKQGYIEENTLVEKEGLCYSVKLAAKRRSELF